MLFTYLRAINVGGLNFHLRRLFESLGFSNAGSFIASGNVIFEAKEENVKMLEKKAMAQR